MFFHSRTIPVSFLLAVFLGCFFLPAALSQTHSGFPVDIVSGPSPQPVLSSGRTWLLYELHLTNYAPLPVELTSLEIFADRSRAPLATYRGADLDKLVIPVEKLSSADEPPASGAVPAIGEGHAVLIFLNISLDATTPPPAQLRHRFSFTVRPKGGALERTVDGPVVPVVAETAPLLSPPLRGSAWIAFNALSSVDHRRSLNAVDGRERIPQRFAIDWMQLGPDHRLFHDDTKSNTNYYGYGAEVLAVARARVSDLKDGLPDNVGANERSTRSVTLENVFGNYIVLDLGRGRFALYAHLQPGSLTVKLGDKVIAGQPLARLGNSGNSDAPHLHFHLVDAGSPMAAEGLPYVFPSFTQIGSVDDQDALLDAGQPWQPKSQPVAVVHRREFPFDKAIVNFP